MFGCRSEARRAGPLPRMTRRSNCCSSTTKRSKSANSASTRRNWRSRTRMNWSGSTSSPRRASGGRSEARREGRSTTTRRSNRCSSTTRLNGSSRMRRSRRLLARRWAADPAEGQPAGPRRLGRRRSRSSSSSTTSPGRRPRRRPGSLTYRRRWRRSSRRKHRTSKPRRRSRRRRPSFQRSSERLAAATTDRADFAGSSRIPRGSCSMGPQGERGQDRRRSLSDADGWRRVESRHAEPTTALGRRTALPRGREWRPRTAASGCRFWRVPQR